MRHVQLYDVARTAHFERVVQSGRRSTILYRQRRYDFDTALAERVGARRAGSLGVFWYMLRTDVDVLEIAEPLVVRGSVRSLAAVAGSRLRALARRRTPCRVTAYAIENLNPHTTTGHLPFRARLSYLLRAALLPVLWRSVDRIAYGTSQAQQLYAELFEGRQPVSTLIPALPVAAVDADAEAPRPPIVVFLGDFSERKGFPLVLDAWARVRDAIPDARLVLIGKGAGLPLAETAADGDPRIDLHVDPPRARLFDLLERSKALVLPSQRLPRWREQVGLPIVEGLGRGCLIVTTAETGLADWLRDHGHGVVDDARDAGGIAGALVAALTSERSPASVIRDLPDVDGRRAAEDWLVADLPTGTGTRDS